MATYLLCWNANRWDWKNIYEQSEAVKRGGSVLRQWSAGKNRRIKLGDRVFIIRVDREPKGIFASGTVRRAPRDELNVDVEGAEHGRKTLVIDIEFDVLENAREKVVIPRLDLNSMGIKGFRWDIRESGALLPDALAEALEKTWSEQTGVAAPAVANEASPEQQSPVEPQKQESSGNQKPKKIAGQKEIAPKKSAAGKQKPAKDDVDSLRLALVTSYFEILQKDITDQVSKKMQIAKENEEKLQSITDEERKQYYQQISALLMEIGMPFLDEYRPINGSSSALELALKHFLEKNLKAISAMRKVSMHNDKAVPDELEDSKMHWVAPPKPLDYRINGMPKALAALHADFDFRAHEYQDTSLYKDAVKFAFAYEKRRLQEVGMKNAASEIERVDDALRELTGYDIASYNDDGSERHILVKPTYYGLYFPFYLTTAELEFAKQSKGDLFIYRIVNFATTRKLFVMREGLSDLTDQDYDKKEKSVRRMIYPRIAFNRPKILEHGKSSDKRVVFLYNL
ncbi:MAG: DUF3883 domain-containing protein [Gammaproteobacteria bacterium]|nr:DUF3883 domain-containing protein [Gammaproteobacteria bacterium]